MDKRARREPPHVSFFSFALTLSTLFLSSLSPLFLFFPPSFLPENDTSTATTSPSRTWRTCTSWPTVSTAFSFLFSFPSTLPFSLHQTSKKVFSSSLTLPLLQSFSSFDPIPSHPISYSRLQRRHRRRHPVLPPLVRARRGGRPGAPAPRDHPPRVRRERGQGHARGRGRGRRRGDARGGEHLLHARDDRGPLPVLNRYRGFF